MAPGKWPEKATGHQGNQEAAQAYWCSPGQPGCPQGNEEVTRAATLSPGQTGSCHGNQQVAIVTSRMLWLPVVTSATRELKGRPANSQGNQ